MAKRIKLNRRQLSSIRPKMSSVSESKPKRYKVTSKGSRGITTPSSTTKKSSDRSWQPSKMKMSPDIREIAHLNWNLWKGPSQLPPGSKPLRRLRGPGGSQKENALAIPGTIVNNKKLKKLLLDRFLSENPINLS